METVKRDGVTLAYRDQGQGRTVVFLHGHTMDGRIFDGFAQALGERGMRVVRPDLRGHGRSSRPSRGYHWSDHCADVVAVLDHADIARADFVGFSLGGGIALEMAITAPERVDSLFLVDPVMPERPFEETFMANLKEVAKTARSEGIRAAMEGPWLRSPLFAASFDKPGIRERAAAIVRDFPGAEYLAEARDHVDRGWTVFQRLDEISAPTLVMVGARDLPGFRAFAEEAANGIPGAGLVVVEGCGHLLPLEAEEQVLEALLKHLQCD